MSWCWFARLAGPDEVAAGALGSAPVTTREGMPGGVLAAWPAGRKPVAAAVRMDERLLDPDGDEAWVSLVLLAPGPVTVVRRPGGLGSPAGRAGGATAGRREHLRA